MKIGFFMGSFDPIHIGHINMIREVLNYVDKVILVPSGHNPWKKHNPAPLDLRVEMCVRAIQPFGDAVEVSGIEGTFEPPYYSNKPLGYFREIYKDDEKYIICGSDTVEKIPRWKNAAEDILPYYTIISLERERLLGNGSQTRHVFDENGKKYEYKMVYSIPLPVSSTYIRELIKEKKETYPLLPSGISELIKEHNLYME